MHLPRQAFNTTTSMGRLTLNVLLSFAQFEREVIGERVRDKIAASKRKGLWMGGPVPLGYASENKKLIIVEPDAETIRGIFRRYLELGSIQALVEELDSSAVRTKERSYSNDRTVGGVRFGTGALAYLLKNRVYIGEVVHQTKIFKGDHAAIVDRDLFEAVQEKLKNNAAERKLRLASSPALLTGRIYDSRGNRMTPSHTVKKGVRYRYYVSRAVLDGDKDKAGCVSRVPAAEIETLILEKLHQNAGLPMLDSADGGRALIDNLQRAVLEKDLVVLHLEPVSDEAEPVVLRMPWTPPAHKKSKGITRWGPESGSIFDESARETLLTAIAKARGWMGKLTEDETTIADIAKAESKSARHIRLLLPLAFVSPAELEAIADGRIVPGTTVTGLAQRVGYVWPKLEAA